MQIKFDFKKIKNSFWGGGREGGGGKVSGVGGFENFFLVYKHIECYSIH